MIAVRGDYWDRCAAYPQLVRAMEHDQLVVGPMPEPSLRRAITGPAQASGLRVDGALIDAIVADVHAADPAPGGAVLPLLSQALTLTWENREGDWLSREGYDRAGASPAPSRSAPRTSTPGCRRTSRPSPGTCSGG